MRGVIASPMHCGSPGFSIPTPGSGQFIHPMQNFSKNMHIMPHNSSIHGNSSFMQPSPLAQLQHQADMWQPYQEPIRPSQPGKVKVKKKISIFCLTCFFMYVDVPPSYLIPPPMSPYPQQASAPPPHQPSEMGDVSPLEKAVKINPESFNDDRDVPPAPTPLQHQHTNENVPPTAGVTMDSDKISPEPSNTFDTKVNKVY